MRKAIITLLTILVGCTFFGGYDELTLQRSQNYRGNFRINGYYYKIYEHSISTIFFYNNGLLLSVSYEKDKIVEIENKIIEGKIEKDKFNYRFDWGIFQIEGDSIKYEKWAAYDGYKPAFLHSGHILNDTTFVITSVSSNSKIFDESKFTKTNTVYRFKHLPLKPDSTNKYIY